MVDVDVDDDVEVNISLKVALSAATTKQFKESNDWMLRPLTFTDSSPAEKKSVTNLKHRSVIIKKCLRCKLIFIFFINYTKGQT